MKITRFQLTKNQHLRHPVCRVISWLLRQDLALVVASVLDAHVAQDERGPGAVGLLGAENKSIQSIIDPLNFKLYFVVLRIKIT